MQNNSRQILISPLFLLGLFILLLNDFALKSEFHNFFTGKLSDFAGLFIFPLFFSAFFPQKKILIVVLTGFLFTFWKSPFSQSSIDLWNSLEFLRIGRTIDYTDLFALSVLPLSYFYFGAEKQERKAFPLDFSSRILASLLILLSVFAFTATSYEEDRHITFDKRYIYKGSKDELDRKLQQLDSISKLNIESQKDAFKNAPIAETLTPNLYFYRFNINKKFCESSNVEMHASAEVKDKFLYFDLPSARFWCKQKPTEQTEKEVLEIFEREVISPSSLILVGSYTENKERK